MKKIITLLAMIIILSAPINVKASELYPETFVIDQIDRSSDIVTGRTTSGHLYSFYGVEDWMVGDIAAAIMDDNGTENIRDDKVIKVRYIGYTDEF